MRVLYVEDKPVHTRIMQKIARMVGCELVLAASGQEALTLLDRELDIILTDIGLPDMEGTALIRQMRQMLPDIPIIAVTAHVLPVDREQCLQAGCTAYVSKPFKFMEMVELLRRYDSACKNPSAGSL